jgi:uncharacterized membrane protein YkvA (DUF1232 family)
MEADSCFKSYTDFLREEIDQYSGEYDYLILYLPELFDMLSRLLTTEIKKPDRIKVSCALAYFVTPCDVIPEEEFGIEGFIDDVFLVCHVLTGIKDRYGIGLLESLWNSEEDFTEVLDYTYLQSSKIIDEKGLREEILKFVGLEEDETPI